MSINVIYEKSNREIIKFLLDQINGILDMKNWGDDKHKRNIIITTADGYNYIYLRKHQAKYDNDNFSLLTNVLDDDHAITYLQGYLDAITSPEEWEPKNLRK